MREIKFRAWDNAIKAMVDEPSVAESAPDHIASLNVNEALNNHEYLVFLQFTGLKDKNEKEVYEGDVVRINNLEEEWKYQEPDFDWRVFAVEWNRYAFAFNNPAIYKPFGNYDTRNLKEWEVEVIGNIYENPELLHQN